MALNSHCHRCLLALLLPLVLLPATPAAADPVCKTQLSDCSCETLTGGKIDLSPLAKTGGFAFTSLGPSKAYSYLYNPCNGTACDTSSGDAAACQRSLDGLHEFLVGTQTTAKFDTQPEAGLYITYTGTAQDGKLRLAMVLLHCDRSGGAPEFTVTTEGSTGPQPFVYRMILKSQHCCEHSGGGGGGGSGSLSGGDILLIVVFCLSAVYLAGGIAVNVFLRHMPLCPDALPNRHLWAALPGLVKDGAVLTFERARGAVGGKKAGQYESI